ncbi:paraquat-inducible protein A [Roseovarius nanhaiticus]|uniref:Paraquat-inducible protein A n=1 Tax=Roseovarius nanhaiticus TaxID=573024 RepID=A0A1N7EMT0_9RHOB|nr:paraquat-inducible protein A [Roseovarius nanhaiticus]SEK71150.1 paraquat-inducible protein A [Roseovarius nanhaiticus]SIR89379.1 paraquat-inducible protein A [Roseovarius nanhaiticus]
MTETQHIAASGQDDPLDALIACPHCDLVYSVPPVKQDERAYCGRCHSVLIAPRRKAGKWIIAMAASILILITGAMFFPFLTIGAGGLTHGTSIVQTSLAFTGSLALLAPAILAFIVIIPMVRLMLLIYVLVPVIRDQPPAPFARHAFRLAEDLTPWSMAEIFAIGCAVALVKLSDLAEVSLGPAAWMFAILMIIVVATDVVMCRYSIWKSLQP